MVQKMAVTSPIPRLLRVKKVITGRTRKALGERRPPPSSTVPPYNDSH